MLAPVQFGDILVNRATLKYEIFGTGVPVIVLHGGPGIGYRYLLPELSDSLSVSTKLILYDQRASGQSTGSRTPELLTISSFVDDLRQLYAALRISRAILLGHSFGGLLAMKFGIQNPDLVTGLILVDTDPPSKSLWSRYPERLRPQSRQAIAELTQIRSTEEWQSDVSRVSRYFELALKPFFAVGSRMPKDFGQRFALMAPENLFGRGSIVRASLGDWDLCSELEHLDTPALIVTGDESIFPEEAVTKLRKSLRNSTVTTLHGVSHFPPIESREAFHQSVAGFIRRLKG